MVGVPQDLAHIERKGFQVEVICKRCRHKAALRVGMVRDLFIRRGWSQTIECAERRFRCGGCGQRAAEIKPCLPAEFAPIGVNQLRPPPPGVGAGTWYRASESERKRLVERARG